MENLNELIRLHKKSLFLVIALMLFIFSVIFFQIFLSKSGEQKLPKGGDLGLDQDYVEKVMDVPADNKYGALPEVPFMIRYREDAVAGLGAYPYEVKFDKEQLSTTSVPTPVYKYSRTGTLTREHAASLAESYGNTNLPVKFADGSLYWENATATIKYNAKQALLDFYLPAEFNAQRPVTSDEAGDIVMRFLISHNLNFPGLTVDKQWSRYVRLTPDGHRWVANAQEANGVLVPIVRQTEFGLTTTPFPSQLEYSYALVNSAGQVHVLRLIYVPLENIELPGFYSTISPWEAFQIALNQTYTLRLFDDNADKSTITKLEYNSIELKLHESQLTTDYLQPVYLVTGDALMPGNRAIPFVQVVPAISSKK